MNSLALARTIIVDAVGRARIGILGVAESRRVRSTIGVSLAVLSSAVSVAGSGSVRGDDRLLVT